MTRADWHRPRSHTLPPWVPVVLFDRRHRGQDALPTALHRSRFEPLPPVGEPRSSCIDRRRQPNGHALRGQCLLRPCIAAAIQADDERKLPLVVGLSTVPDQGTNRGIFPIDRGLHMSGIRASRTKKGIGKFVGQQIRHLRKTRGMTQLDLAYESCMGIDIVGKIERADVSPTLQTLAQIADGLGVPIARLLEQAESANSMTTTHASGG